MNGSKRHAATRMALGRALIVILALLALVMSGNPASATPGVNDYPYQSSTTCPGGCVEDPWKFYMRECTSFVAWRMTNDNAFTGFMNTMTGPNGQTRRLSDASNWGTAAAQMGYAVNMTPAVGSVAWWNTSSIKHVAWVKSISGSNVVIEEYNWNFNHNYNTRTIAASSVSGYIHFMDITAPPPAPPLPPSVNDVPASGTTHTAAGDFNGDGHDDAATLYNYGGNNSAIYEFQGSSTGLSAPAVKKFESGPGNWSWDQSKVTASDVNGDGYSDFIVLYDYSNAVTGMNVFPGSATGLSSSWTQMWGGSSWLLSNTKIVGGDYDGDGIGDVAAMYDYGGGNTAIFMFKGNTAGSLSAVKYWESGPGNFSWVNTKPFATDTNGDGKSELLVMYNYGGANTGLFSFNIASAATSQFTQPWSSNGWYWTSSKFATGDFNNDGYGDIAAMYDYGSCDTGMFVFVGSSTGVQTPYQPWRTGPGQWCLANAKLASGGFTGGGDSLDDLAAFYDYGNSNTGLFVLPGPTLARQSAYANWASGAGQWGWDRM